MKRRLGLALLLAWFPLWGSAAGCDATPRLRVATTTSVENSGLLIEILPVFEQAQGVAVDVLPVGSGRALNLLKRGDVAVGMTHDPTAEAAALDAGFVDGYRKVMYNDFVLVGPPTDPARLSEASGVLEALHRVVDHRAVFVSRGDESGTHTRERELWALARRQPSEGQLLETGQGMAATLRVTSERGAYTLTDRATFERVRRRLRLEIVFEGGPELLNTYAVFHRADLTGTELELATAFARWLTVGEGRQLIARFTADERPVFHVWPAGIPGTHPADRPHAR